MGPMLGGGYGLLQGKYGLLADNLISARVVLANGTMVTASTDSHPDLLWAVKGAGHNFGIVTSIEYKVYDVPPNDEWTVFQFVFTGNKVEAVYTALNALTDSGEMLQAEDLALEYSMFLRIPEIDAENVCPPIP